MLNPNIHGAKVILCIWWDQKGVIHCELVKPSQTIMEGLYWQQLILLKRSIAEKRAEYATRHESIIFYYESVRPNVAVPVKKCLEDCGWKNVLIGICFNSEQDIKNWLNSFFGFKITRKMGKSND